MSIDGVIRTKQKKKKKRNFNGKFSLYFPTPFSWKKKFPILLFAFFFLLLSKSNCNINYSRHIHMFYVILYIDWIFEGIFFKKEAHSLILKYETNRFANFVFVIVPSLYRIDRERAKLEEGGGCLARYNGFRRRGEFSSLPHLRPTPRASASRWKGFRPRRCSSKPSLERTNKSTMGSGSLGCDEIQLNFGVKRNW